MIDKNAIGTEPRVIKNLRIIRSILNVILCIIIIPILLISLTMFINKIKNPKETPSFFGYKFFVIMSGSMKDYLHIGDFIVTEPVSEENLNVQDIISFNSNQAVITHRIIKVQDTLGKTTYITKGDNNNTEDETLIEISDIEGKLLFKIPYIGKILISLQTIKGVTILVSIPIIITIISINMNNYIAQKKIIRKTKRLKYDEENNENRS